MSEISESKVLDIIDFLKENDEILSTKTLFAFAEDLGLSQKEILNRVSGTAW